ncbi:MAG: hypothetical protein KAG61_06075 [Bacteriovoracaceae bacterium]|nr:hypothetical protein [Bacteriovoracaceae bacterium]
MSSQYVREQMLTHLQTTFPTEKIVDLTAQYKDLYEFLADNSIGKTDNWIGVQFTGGPDDLITIGSDGGCYRETGAILLHVVAPLQIGVVGIILPRVELIRKGLRGTRVNLDITIDSTTTPNFEAGATLEFSGGYTSGTTVLNYHRDETL